MSPEEIAMRKARFTEHQIITVLKSVEAGRTVKDVCREAGISEASNYNWKTKYGGMEAPDIKKMKDLEDENRRLKQMFADLSLECRENSACIPTSAHFAVNQYVRPQYGCICRQ
jgi:putative transposase